MIPVEFIFNPNWWFRNYGISFDRPFYFDPRARIDNDVRMRRALHERFGLGEPDPQPRPIAGSRHVAGGFVIPALLGVEILFADNQAPWNLPANLSRDQILALRVPELETTWPMSEWIAQMDALEKEFGYVVGDFNTGGVINTALELRGQQLFLDMLEDTELTAHVFRVVAETTARVAAYVKGRTGTCSVAVNRSIVNVDSGDVPRQQLLDPDDFAAPLPGDAARVGTLAGREVPAVRHPSLRQQPAPLRATLCDDRGVVLRRRLGIRRGEVLRTVAGRLPEPAPEPRANAPVPGRRDSARRRVAADGGRPNRQSRPLRDQPGLRHAGRKRPRRARRRRPHYGAAGRPPLNAMF